MALLKSLEKRTYLTFQLEDEIFAVDVLHVHEVLEFTTVTKIPGVPDFVRGIINLRGMVVPVVDLRLKFGMTATEKSRSTCVIVLDVGSGENKTVIGALADSVKEVFEFEPGQVEPPPRIGTFSRADFIQGIGKREDQFIIILNINRVFSSDEVVLLGAAAEEDGQEDETDAMDREEDGGID
ncbi:MAG: chemotaxis protein CheW [Desulfobulbaceae bacterium]|nr:chemotaxis protein CheW [Desulfobulbaceae bacterium]